MVHFNELKPKFFYNLESKYNNLSKNEIKLAALLSMNLTTKEISKILNIELNSVSKNRQRLRKKLNISKEIDLIDYFKKF